MRILKIVFICVVLSLATSKAEVCRNDAGDDLPGSSCFLTSHTFTHQLVSTDTAWADVGEIKEYHFHTYWFQNRPESYAAALRIQEELISAVGEGKFIVVLPGITKEILPNIEESQIPHINTEPIGPHPCGSFETWVPKEYLNEALSFFMQRRGELTILIHARTRWENEDHFARNMWLGPPMKIDATVLGIDLGEPPIQYPELRLGYSAQ
jgi:DOPA 4,5-dioxygenase